MEGFDTIYRYTRAQAIADGVLVDVTSKAATLGIKFPVAVTAGVWAACVEMPEPRPMLDEPGRLHALLQRFLDVVQQTSRTDDRVHFTMYVCETTGLTRKVDLWAMCGPGDDAEPVITIMLQGED